MNTNTKFRFNLYIRQRFNVDTPQILPTLLLTGFGSEIHRTTISTLSNITSLNICFVKKNTEISGRAPSERLNSSLGRLQLGYCVSSYSKPLTTRKKLFTKISDHL